MSRHPIIAFTSLLLLSAACSSSTDGPNTEAGGSAGEDAGGGSASAGSAPVSAAGAGAGGGAGHSGASGQSGSAASAGSGASGASGSGFSPGGAGGGAHAGGGGTGANGGAGATSGGSTTGGTGGRGGAGGASGGASGMTCPGAGHITYTIAKSASPTATEQAAYDKIKIAMDKAITYYDCYTSITKSLNVSYVPSVETADGNINGSIRFGMNTTYMDYRSAMHEIAHTVGIGQASNWGTFLSGGLFTGSHAAAQLQAINAKLATPLYTDVHADTQHFWPYGINQQSEVKSEADLIAHCQMVLAIRQDLGL
jgi:hypothetical protein